MFHIYMFTDYVLMLASLKISSRLDWLSMGMPPPPATTLFILFDNVLGSQLELSGNASHVSRVADGRFNCEFSTQQKKYSRFYCTNAGADSLADK